MLLPHTYVTFAIVTTFWCFVTHHALTTHVCYICWFASLFQLKDMCQKKTAAYNVNASIFIQNTIWYPELYFPQTAKPSPLQPASHSCQMKESDAEQVSRSSWEVSISCHEEVTNQKKKKNPNEWLRCRASVPLLLPAQTFNQTNMQPVMRSNQHWQKKIVPTPPTPQKREKRHIPCNNIGVCPIKRENRLTNRQTRCKHEKYRQTNKKQRKIHLACNKMALSPAEDSSSSSCATSTNLPLVPEHNHHLHHHHHHLHHHHHPWIFSFSAGSPMWSRPDTFVGLTAHLIGNCKLAKCNPFHKRSLCNFTYVPHSCQMSLKFAAPQTPCSRFAL